MKILKNLVEKYHSNHKLKEIIAGKHNILVESEKGGMASTLSAPEPTEKYKLFEINELINLVFSNSLFETAIGIASLNSIIPVDNAKIKQINAKNLLIEKGRGKNAAVIGHFPFVDKIGKNFNQFHVFEKNPINSDYHSDKIPELLPDADVVAITGSTFINKTFLDVMKYVNHKAFVIVLGPSTPISEILFDYGVNAVCGSLVSDIKTVKSQMKFAKHFRDLEGITGVSLIKE